MSQNDTTPAAIAQLARVVEIEASQIHIEAGSPPRRDFHATCGDGSLCHLTTGGLLIGGDVIYCRVHDSVNQCEGAYRAAAVICAEKLHGYKLTLLGLALKDAAIIPDAPNNSTPALTLVDA